MVTFANNLSAIPRDIRVANATFSTSFPTSRIISKKHTLLAKRGFVKRVNFIRSFVWDYGVIITVNNIRFWQCALYKHFYSYFKSNINKI